MRRRFEPAFARDFDGSCVATDRTASGFLIDAIAMPTCILHVGMPKTGTSSIQESLYFGLDDPRFRYVNLGDPNGSLWIETIFAERPEDFWVFRMKGRSFARLRLARRFHSSRFRRALRRARANSCTPIISAETLWHASPEQLRRVRDVLDEEGFTTRVIAYLRPVKALRASSFQQAVKWGRDPFAPIRALRGDTEKWPSPWLRRLEVLERIVGRENLVVRPFVRSALAEGCVVLDFCRTVGVTIDSRSVRRSNESLCADAVRFLFAYDRFASAASRPGFRARMLLIKQFEDLDGPRVRLHEDLFAPAAEAVEREEETILDRYGIDLSGNRAKADGGPRIREEADMFRYSRASLDWLAETSRSNPIAACEGEEAARAVAAQVDRIRRRPSWRKVRELLAGKIRTNLRWIRHGD